MDFHKYLMPFSFLLSLLLASQALSGFTCDPNNVAANNCRHLVKLNAAAGLGQCLPEGPPSDIPGLLSRNNIRAFTGHNPRERGFSTQMQAFADVRDPRIVALARVVEAMDSIGDGRFTTLEEGDQIDVIFARPGSPARNSRRYGSQIQITGGHQNMTGTQHTSTCGGMDNHGLIAHEIGHYIAGNNQQKVYNEYVRFMRGNRCRLTSYCAESLGEEIAEVIAAYITMPQAFQGKGESCQQAFNYMKELFGEPNMTMSCEARRSSYRRLPETRMANEVPPRTRPGLNTRSRNVVF